MLKQTIHNNFLKVEPVENPTFFQGDVKFQEIGVVIDKDKRITDIKIGDTVFFDSWLVKKYPVVGDDDKSHWLIPYDQIVMSHRKQKEK